MKATEAHDSLLNQITKQLPFQEPAHTRCLDDEGEGKRYSPVKSPDKAELDRNVQTPSSVLDETVENSVKEEFVSPESKLQMENNDANGTELRNDKETLQASKEEPLQDSNISAQTPINQSSQVSFQLVGSDASKEWCGEHFRFSVLGKSKVKVQHEPKLKTISPVRSDEQEDAETSTIEDSLDDATPEPQKLDFSIDNENHKDDSLESASSKLPSSDKSYLDNSLKAESREGTKSPGENSPTSSKRSPARKFHFSKQTQSFTLKGSQFSRDAHLQWEKENIDESGNSLHWKGQHIRFEDSPDIIEEKMKNLHLDPFTKPSVSGLTKSCESRNNQKLASKYLWRF